MCAGYRKIDPGGINVFIEETFGGGLLARGFIGICAHLCDDAGRAVSAVGGRLCGQ